MCVFFWMVALLCTAPNGAVQERCLECLVRDQAQVLLRAGFLRHGKVYHPVSRVGIMENNR